MSAWNPTDILVTGASSGIGRALALALAAPGRRLVLHGRDVARLDATASACAAKGAAALTSVFDVTDAKAARDAVTGAAPFDLVIANAGVSGGAGGPKRVMEVNVMGTLNTVEPAIVAMRKAGGGQIALLSSLASFKGFPNAPAYCGAKAAIRLYGEGLRGRLGADGIKVSVVCPGFVRTPLTAANPFPMPFLMDPDAAAARILKGLAHNRARIAFPRRLYWPSLWLSWLPPGLTDKAGSGYAGKEG